MDIVPSREWYFDTSQTPLLGDYSLCQHKIMQPQELA